MEIFPRELTVPVKKVDAWDFDGRLYKTEEDAREAKGGALIRDWLRGVIEQIPEHYQEFLISNLFVRFKNSPVMTEEILSLLREDRDG